MTAPTITGHCATCSGPVVSDPDAVLCRACWARENAGAVEDTDLGALLDDLIDAGQQAALAAGVDSSRRDVNVGLMWDLRARVLALHAAAVAAAEARGRAAATREVDAALDLLHDGSSITFVAIDRAVIGRPSPRWSAECLPNRGTYSVADTPTAAILAAAAALAPATDEASS